MKWISTWLVLAAACVFGAESVTLSWRANTETNLVGYRVYAGTNSRQYHLCLPTGLVTNQQIVLPVTGRWFFCVTATNNAGRESAYSAEVVLEPKPATPVVDGTPWVKLTPVMERSTDRTNWTNVASASTWLPATNAVEVFTVRRLEIERMQLINQP